MFWEDIGSFIPVFRRVFSHTSQFVRIYLCLAAGVGSECLPTMLVVVVSKVLKVGILE